ncbi:EscU/YscU/HrcU family type III secretion system export apparatus switch protein [Pseudidiomarina marina]|uniref:Flagellar biosynthetic protein FlhB n=1 Tax=Pseudidiomarina marina TaxID=502366 RepID=A0A432YGJ8_9GAMM|nr:EscU/YscU/HrcU family type III secretion system export apparatus switch protein [Pseudidiomarina marina]RUO60064.1 flagellar biosynthesis protein [Pseudidiomarina marina]
MADDLSKTKKAVALRYQEFEPAPKIVAKGEGLIADKIIALASEHNVFVHDSPELVDLLSQIDLDEYIPQTLWLVVAELLIWAKSVDASR